MKKRMALVSRQRDESGGEDLIIAKHYWEIRPRDLRYFFLMIQNFKTMEGVMKKLISSLGLKQSEEKVKEYWIEVAGIRITKEQEKEFWSTPKKMQWCRDFIAYALEKSNKINKEEDFSDKKKAPVKGPLPWKVN